MYLLVVLAICTLFVCVMLINSYLCAVAGEKSGNEGKALGLLYLKIAQLTNNEKSLLTRWCRISMLDISAKRGYTVYFRWAFGDASNM